MKERKTIKIVVYRDKENADVGIEFHYQDGTQFLKGKDT